jgi:hypothetical protein
VITRKIIQVSNLLIKSKRHQWLDCEDGLEIFNSYCLNYSIDPHLNDVHEVNQERSFFTLFHYKEIGNIKDYEQIVQLTKVPCMKPGYTVEFLYVIYDDEETMNEDIKITGALDKIRYITAEVSEDYTNKPYIYVKNSKYTIKKVYDHKMWPSLLF